jgi:small-conductance mechanosensitive channel
VISFEFMLQSLYLPLAISIGSFLCIWILKKYVMSRLEKVSSKTEASFNRIILHILSKTSFFFILCLSIYIGVHFTFRDDKFGNYSDRILVILLAFQGIIWAREAVTNWVEYTIQKRNNDPSVRTTVEFIALILKFSLVVAIVLFTFNNLGFNVSTFITGLGVGGIAIALATQNILGDLFSSLSIVLDKPFVVGDSINLGDMSGTVERVGLKTTRLRSLTGEQIVISNSNLLSARIRNYKRMKQRRAVINLGLTYSTKREDLKKAPALIEEIISRQEKTKFERAHFLNYGAYALEIEVVYWILTPDYMVYADTHQKILFEIHDVFEKNNLEFAFPTQTVILEKT